MTVRRRRKQIVDFPGNPAGSPASAASGRSPRGNRPAAAGCELPEFFVSCAFNRINYGTERQEIRSAGRCRQISHRKIKDILDEIANYGTPTIKRIYGDFTNPKFAAWKEVLLENSITPIQQYAYTTGKNATDSALIIDAMDILHKEGVDGFCIVSSDSDYTRLASRIRESGREVLGFGEKKTPKPFIKSCDKFIYVEILGQTPPPEKAAPAKKKADAKRSAGAEAPVGPAAETAGEKKPSPDAGHASTIIRPFDDEFRTLLENTIDDAADDSGWASLGDVGSVLSKKMPDFDPRNYGYKKLSLLVRALSDAVDMKTEQQRVYVRNRVG